MYIFVIISILILNIYAEEQNSTKKRYSLKFIKDLSRDSDSKGSMIFHSLLIKDFNIGNQFEIDSKLTLENYDDNIKDNYGDQDYSVKYRFNRKLNILDIKLIDRVSNKIILEKEYNSTIENKYPFLIHRAVSDIFKALKLIDISWINRYLIFSKFISHFETEIWISDYTLTFKKPILERGINIFPKWSNAEQTSFYFTSYNALIPNIYRYNIESGYKTKIAESNGIIICSDVSEDYRKLILSMSPNGQSDIYELNIIRNEFKKITRNKEIDINGKYINKNKILFLSNRFKKIDIFLKYINKEKDATKIIFDRQEHSSMDVQNSTLIYLSGDKIIFKNLQSRKETIIYQSHNLISFIKILDKKSKYIIFYEKSLNSKKIVYLNRETKKYISIPVDEDIKSLDF